jgi:hypothetical protein
MRASPENLGEFCSLRMAAYRAHQERNLPRGASSIDPVIAHNHFTNVYRELDPGTALAMEIYRGQPLDVAAWQAVAYRLTNRRQVWEAWHADMGAYPRPIDEGPWLNYLEELMAAGQRVFTGRHLTLGFRKYVETLQDIRTVTGHSDIPRMPRSFGSWVRGFRGVGQFFQWQVTADLMASGHLAPDTRYVVLGPGAKFGLRFIEDGRDFRTAFNAAGRRVVAAGNGHMGDQQAEDAILLLWTNQRAWLPASFVPLGDRDLSLVDLEHALCEYGKWGILHARRELGLR